MRVIFDGETNQRAAAALAALLLPAGHADWMVCGAAQPGVYCWTCTRQPGHRGLHVAGGPAGEVYFAWED